MHLCGMWGFRAAVESRVHLLCAGSPCRSPEAFNLHKCPEGSTRSVCISPPKGEAQPAEATCLRSHSCQADRLGIQTHLSLTLNS